MDEFIDLFRTKRNIASLLVFGILVLALPLLVNLAKNQQVFFGKAAVVPITLLGDNVHLKSDGTSYITPDASNSPTVSVKLISPFGVPSSATAPLPSGSLTTPSSAAPTVTTSAAPTTPMTLSAAIAAAKQALGNCCGAFWKDASDQAIIDAVCGSKTLFVGNDPIGITIRTKCTTSPVTTFSLRVNLGDSAQAALTPGGKFGYPNDWVNSSQHTDHTATLKQILSELTASQVAGMQATINSGWPGQSYIDKDKQDPLGDYNRGVAAGFQHPELYVLLRAAAFNNKELFNSDPWQP